LTPIPLFPYIRVCGEGYTCGRQSWTSTNKASAARNMVPKHERTTRFIRNELRVSRIGFWSFLNISNPSYVAGILQISVAHSGAPVLFQPHNNKKGRGSTVPTTNSLCWTYAVVGFRSIRTYTVYPTMGREATFMRCGIYCMLQTSTLTYSSSFDTSNEIKYDRDKEPINREAS
jgi:hypothetical protein